MNNASDRSTDGFSSNCQQQAEAFLAQGQLEEALAIVADLAQKGQPDVAIACYRQAIEAYPERGDIYHKLGELLQAKGELSEAATIYQRAIALNPHFSWSYHNLGDVLFKQEKWEEAVVAYRHAVELNSNFFWSYHNLGYALSQQEKWEEAVAAYQHGISLNPDFSWTYHNLGYALSQQEKWEEAATAYHSAAQLNPNFCWTYCNLGDVLVRQRKWEEAATAYCQAAQIEPDLPGVYAKLGETLQRRWNLENLDAEDRLTDCKNLEIFLEDDQTYCQFGQLLAKENYLEPALNFYQVALENQPDDSEISREFERVLKKKSELDAEVLKYRRAVRDVPDSCWSYYNLAVALTRQQKREEAVALYLQAIELKPDFYWWFYYNLWDTLEKQNQLEQAVSLCRRLVAEKSDAFWPYLNLGEALTRQGQLAEAIECYQTANYKHVRWLLAHTRPNLSQSLSLIPVKKPDFIILGTQRGGTTSLYSYLMQHPQILCPVKKELDFWSWHFRRGIQWYLAHFPPLPEGQNLLTGEASPSYLDYREAPERLWNIFPEVKLIVLLRNPVDRAISHYYRLVGLNWEHRSLEEALAHDLERLNQNPNHLMGEEPGNYISRGLYIEYIKKWLAVFPREQLLILKSEDFYANTATSMQQICQFLNVSDGEYCEYKNENPGLYQTVSESLRQMLNDYFKPYNKQLEEYLGMRFNWS